MVRKDDQETANGERVEGRGKITGAEKKCGFEREYSDKEGKGQERGIWRKAVKEGRERCG